jgi:hypothetical protein
MLPRESYLFGGTWPKPCQGSVPAALALASDFSFCFQYKGGPSLVLRRPIEITALTGKVDFPSFRLRDKSGLHDCDIKALNAMTAEGIYDSAFARGTSVRVAERAFLERFMAEWNYHHKLQPEQLAYTDAVAVVEKVGFYHGGDVLYNLKDVPRIWHERCLRAASPTSADTRVSESRII